MTFGTNVTVAVLSLLNVVVISRTLGPTGRGHVVFLTTIAILASHLATSGVQESNANLAGSSPALRPALATNSVVMAVIFGAFAASFVVLLIAIFPAAGGNSDPELRWLALGTIPLLILHTYLQLLAQADYRFGVTNLAWLITPVTALLTNGALAALGLLTVGRAVGAWVVGQALATGLLALSTARGAPGFGRPDFALARRSLVFGLKTHTGRVMTVGNYRLDQWLLGAIAGPRELGLYSVAVAWSEALFYLPTTLTQVQRPDLVRAARGEAARRGAAVFATACVVTVPLAVAIIVAAPILCVTVFGGAFRGAIDDLRILAVGAFGMVALKLLGNVLTAQRKPLHATAGIAVAFLTMIALDILLIPDFGGAGAALASTIAYTFGGTAILLIFARTLDARLREFVPRSDLLLRRWRRPRSV